MKVDPKAAVKFKNRQRAVAGVNLRSGGERAREKHYGGEQKDEPVLAGKALHGEVPDGSAKRAVAQMATLRAGIGLRIHLSRSSQPAIKHRLMISREIFRESHARAEARADIYHCCRRFEHFSFALQAHVDLRAARKRVEHVDVTTL